MALYRQGGLAVLRELKWGSGALVMDLAKTLNSHLEFLPAYSPNLNLIERLWKFIKKQVLYRKHYGTFQDFHGVLNGCLAKIPTEHQEKLNSLMTPNFQTFNPASFLAARSISQLVFEEVHGTLEIGYEQRGRFSVQGSQPLPP